MVLLPDKDQKIRLNPTNIRANSKQVIFLAVCAFFAFLIRLLLIPQETSINWDGAFYATLGAKIISGDVINGISAYWSPLYPLLIGVSSLFFQDLEFAGRFVSVIAGTALIFPSYFLMRSIYERSTANVGVILIVFLPSLIHISGWVMAESLYIFIITTGILTGWNSLKYGNKRDFFVTGLLFGAAFLTKPEAMGFLGWLFAFTVATKLFSRKFSFRRLASGYLILLTGFAIFLVPYVTIIHQKTGRWMLTQKIQNNISLVDSGKRGLEITTDGQSTRQDQVIGDDYSTQNLQTEDSSEFAIADSPHTRFDLKNFGSKIFHNFRKQLKQHVPTILPYPLILMALAGFFYKPWTRLRLAKEVYLSSFLICTLLGYSITMISLRYTYTIIPILICWVSHGIVMFSIWTSKSIRNYKATIKINPFFIQILILVISVSLLVPMLFQRNPGNDSEVSSFEEKRAGLWIRNHKTSPSLIMASSPRVAFYAEEKYTFLPDEEFTKILEYAKRKKVTYIYMSRRRLSDTPLILIPDENNLPAELKLVYKEDQDPSSEVFIYQLIN